MRLQVAAATFLGRAAAALVPGFLGSDRYLDGWSACVVISARTFVATHVEAPVNAINVEVPTVGESISEVQIGQWLKAEGDWVDSGEDLVEIETEKASVNIPSPAAGVLQGIKKAAEEFATVGEVIAAIEPSDKPRLGRDRSIPFR